MKSILRLALATVCAFTLLALQAVSAQQVQIEGSVNLTPFEARGITLSTLYKVDGEFAGKHGIPVPAPFTLAAPRRGGQQILAQAKPAGGGPIKIYFATDDAQKRIFSSLQVIPFTMKSDDLQKRLEIGDYLAIDLLKKLGENRTTRVNLRRQITIGGLPAAEVVGNFVNGEGDQLLVRLVAVAKPGSPHGIIGIAVGHPRQGRIKKVEDIYDTSASLAFDTVAFN